MSKSGDSSLHDWFNKSKSSDGKKGWVQLGGKYAGKPCAKQPGQTTKPKCGSSKMKRDLNKDEEQAAFRRKNKKDPNPNRKGKAINVATEEKEVDVTTIAKELDKASKMHKGQANKLRKHAKDMNEACWKGYEKKGMKTMFGKRYPNCVKKTKKEEVELKSVQDIIKEKAGEKDACYHKVKSRYKVWPSAYASGALVKCRKKGASNWGNSTKKEEYSNWRDELDYVQEGAAWTKKEGQNKSGGLNEKGRKSYERENPGSDLKAPSKKPGNKRRASFCARMKGMKKKLTSAKTANDPDSRINKSLRAWNCSYEPDGTPIMEKEDKAFNFVVSKLKAKYGSGVMTKGDKMPEPSAAQKKKNAAIRAKRAKEDHRDPTEKASDGRYSDRYSNRGSD